MLQHMEMGGESISHMEDTPSYRTLLKAGLLTVKYRKRVFEDIFLENDFMQNASKAGNLKEWFKYGACCCCCLYSCTHTEIFVPAGHIGLLVDDECNYLFAQPGMHNIKSVWTKHVGTKKLPVNDQLQHGNRVILVVEQGFVGIAFDNGQPVLFPPGIHVWKSETLKYNQAVSLDQHVVKLGPYALLTVDEGYAAVTQNNGKQQICMGGHTWLLNHKNWRFEKFLTLKIQTDDLEKIEATSADNITMMVTSTVTWRILDPTLAATMAAETMSICEFGKVSSDITKLRKDVLKQAIASLASFMGGVNYSDSFGMAAAAANSKFHGGGGHNNEPEAEQKCVDNPLYDSARMVSSVEHANRTTKSYGIEILSINILSAVPNDMSLTKALACGAVASAQALQAETAARGNAKAMKIEAQAIAEKVRISSEGEAEAEIITAKAKAEAVHLIADGNTKASQLLASCPVAVDLAKMDKSATLIGKNDKFFFGQEPAYLANLVLKGGAAAGKAGIFG